LTALEINSGWGNEVKFVVREK